MSQTTESSPSAQSEPEPSEPSTVVLVLPAAVLVFSVVAIMLYLYLHSHWGDVKRQLTAAWATESSAAVQPHVPGSALARWAMGRCSPVIAGRSGSVQGGTLLASAAPKGSSADQNDGCVEDMSLEELERLVLSSQDQLGPLLGLAIPCILSVSLCPLLLLWAGPFKEHFWPGEESMKAAINDALSVFLVPASLLYALLFTVSFEMVMQKQTEVRILLNKEVNIMYEMLELSHFFQPSSAHAAADVRARLNIARVILSQGVALALQLRGVDTQAGAEKTEPGGAHRSHGSKQWGVLKAVSATMSTTLKWRNESKTAKMDRWNKASSEAMDRVNQDYAHRLWSILPEMKILMHGDVVDSILLSKVVDQIMDFGTDVAQRRAWNKQKLNLFLWVFLETLGFICFFAVLLIDAKSPKMELAMCMITAFSISLLTLVVADADEPCHGFFKVKVRSLLYLVRHTATEAGRLKRLAAEIDAGERLTAFRNTASSDVEAATKARTGEEQSKHASESFL